MIYNIYIKGCSYNIKIVYKLKFIKIKTSYNARFCDYCDIRQLHKSQKLFFNSMKKILMIEIYIYISRIQLLISSLCKKKKTDIRTLKFY